MAVFSPATSQTPYLESEMKTEIPINYDIEYPVLLRKYHELCNESSRQRDAALKLADLWEAQAIKYPLENATSLVSPYTAEAVAVGQAAVRACANELRAIFEPKEGK